MISQRWIILFALTILMLIVNVDYTAVSLALVSICDDLHTTLHLAQWTLSAYAMAWAVGVIPGGNLADGYGLKRTCLLGVSLFLISSLFAGFSQNIETLIFSRLLQGLSSALYITSCYGLIHSRFEENERGKAIGILSFGVGVGMALGPFVGGVLITFVNWRGIFWVNVPLAAGVLFLLAKDPIKDAIGKRPRMNLPSLILLILSIVPLLIVLNQWQDLETVWGWWLSGAAFAGAGLIYLQKRLEQPLIPLTLFKNRSYLSSSLAMFLEQYNFSAVVIAMGLYLQKTMQYSVFKSSLMYLFLSLVFGVIATFGGRWSDRIGFKMISVVGLVILGLATCLFAGLNETSTQFWMSFVFALSGIGMGLAFAGLNTSLVKTAPAEQVGIATAVFSVTALLGNVISVTVTSLLFEYSQSVSVSLILSASFSFLGAGLCALGFKNNAPLGGPTPITPINIS